MSSQTESRKEKIAALLHVKGRVQGVGFRPYIFRLAIQKKLTGTVYNRADGVVIHIEGSPENCSKFRRELKLQAPDAAIIKEVKFETIRPEQHTEFKIIESQKSKEFIAEICPDIAICDACVDELYSKDRRKDYPFINCTNCGPRFTLIENFPYDRKHTTMQEFSMCPECTYEYNDPANRRFHAQPVSCYNCGPKYKLHLKDGIITDFQKIIIKLGEQINAGSVVALKGLGGYNIACDAFNDEAVNELRSFKKRERKPFAVLFRSIDTLVQAIEITPEEKKTLLSWRRPIVILNGKMKKPLPGGISSGLKTLGAFLPYIPLQHLLFDQLKTDAIVLSSGNESDTPILCEDDIALKSFKNISGGILINNRKIARRADDSVVRIICEAPLLMRRSRGYTPDPIDLNFNVDGIIATGAELSNTFCIGKGKQAIFSQHIGDLKNYETLEFFKENIEKFSGIYRFESGKIACDLHPDYLSTQYAKESGLPLIEVQHHHAHIAAVMAEYGLQEPVIGIAYDGTGLGTDGNIWGSEVMFVDYTHFERISHFEYIPLPGGDSVTKEPWRTGLSYLYKAYGKEWQNLKIPFCENINSKKAGLLIEAIDKGINSPLSCSAGRLFDALAAILGICMKSNYHAEAPQLLENYLSESIHNEYSFTGSESISFSPMIREIIKDLSDGIALDKIITSFHNTIARAALSQVQTAYQKHKTNKVVLSGGSFQNKYLTEKLVHLLHQNSFEVFLPREVSCNDGGIALGQLAVAAHKKI